MSELEYCEHHNDPEGRYSVRHVKPTSYTEDGHPIWRIKAVFFDEPSRQQYLRWINGQEVKRDF